MRAGGRRAPGLLLAGLTLLGLALPGPAGAEGLGTIPPCVPVADPPQHPERHERHERVGLFRDTAWLFLRAYQIGVSPGDGDRCGLSPSCSDYTAQAVRRDGVLLGGWLGAARILSSHRDPDLPLCTDGGRVLRRDPPQEGAFWRRSR